MRKIGILSLVLVCVSCKIFKMSGEEKLTRVSDEMQLELVNGQLLTNVLVKDSTYKFIFDTGASTMLVNDTMLIDKYNTVDKYKSNSRLIKSRVSIDKTAFTSSNELYAAEKEVVAVLIPEKLPCFDRSDVGLLSTNYFTKNVNKIVNLDFESLKVKIIDESQKQQMLLDYKEIKSEFFHFRKLIKIFLKINGTEEAFLLDTGNSAIPFLIGEASKLKLNNGIEYQGTIMMGADHAVSIDRNIIYNNANVTIGKETIKSMVFYNQAYKSKYNNVGLSFIKNFNWILDYKNKKVYYKQIKADFIKEVKPFRYRVYNTDDTLSISVKLSSATAYNLGDQITSVNDVAVTTENICELQSLLNKTEDWNTLKLEVIPVKTKK